MMLTAVVLTHRASMSRPKSPHVMACVMMSTLLMVYDGSAGHVSPSCDTRTRQPRMGLPPLDPGNLQAMLSCVFELDTAYTGIGAEGGDAATIGPTI